MNPLPLSNHVILDTKHQNPIDILQKLYKGNSTKTIVFWETNSIEYYPDIQQWIEHYQPAFKVLFGFEFVIKDLNLSTKVIAEDPQGIQNIFKLFNKQSLKDGILLLDFLSYCRHLILTFDKKQWETHGEENQMLIAFLKNDCFYTFSYNEDLNQTDIFESLYFYDFLKELNINMFLLDIDKIEPFLPFKNHTNSFDLYTYQTLFDTQWESAFDLTPEDKLYPILEERVNRELDLIYKNQWMSYFVIARDIAHEMYQRNIFVNTKGSFAGSFVAYLLGIADTSFADLRYYDYSSTQPFFECEFELSFPSQCLLEMNFPTQTFDSLEFLEDVFRKKGLQALELKSAFSKSIYKSSLFVLYPYTLTLPQIIDSKGNLICLYTKNQLMDYFHVVGLYGNNILDILYQNNSFLPEGTTNLADFDLCKIPAENISGIDIKKLVQLKEMLDMELKSTYDLQNLIGMYITYGFKYKQLQTIISREDMYYQLINNGLDRKEAIKIVKKYLTNNLGKYDIRDFLNDDFDDTTYLFPQSHINELTNLFLFYWKNRFINTFIYK